MSHRRDVEQASVRIHLTHGRKRHSRAGLRAHREVGADGKDPPRPLSNVHEHLRRRLAIESVLAHVLDHTDDLPGPAVVADVDLEADRILVRQFAARGGLVDQQHTRPTRGVTVGQASSLDDPRAHDGEVVAADEAPFRAARDEPRRALGRTSKERVLSEAHQWKLLRVGGGLHAGRRTQACREIFGECTNPVRGIARGGQRDLKRKNVRGAGAGFDRGQLQQAAQQQAAADQEDHRQRHFGDYEQSAQPRGHRTGTVPQTDAESRCFRRSAGAEHVHVSLIGMHYSRRQPEQQAGRERGRQRDREYGAVHADVPEAREQQLDAEVHTDGDDVFPWRACSRPGGVSGCGVGK